MGKKPYHQGGAPSVRLHAPYRFIPLSRWVHVPGWARAASQDQPFADGVSGWLDLAITARTPLLVGDGASGTAGARFYTLPDGARAIPGASLRGLIRSVVEIAGFGQAAFIDQRRYGVRDLYNRDFYTRWMTTGGGGAPIRYLMRAGWLRGGPGRAAEIVPCQWAKVHVSDLTALSGTNAAQWEPRNDAPRRYAIWGRAPLAHSLPVDDVEQPYTHSVGTILYRRAGGTAAGPTTVKAGTIVLTGKPARGTLSEARKKKFEFFFYDTAATPVSVADLWPGFAFIHEEQLGAAGGTGNSAWPDYWKPRFLAGQPVPVFYIEQGGRITSFGLASMFRLAYEFDTHDLLRHTDPKHLDAECDDFAHLLFGRAPARAEKGGAGGGRRGRVAFEAARQTAGGGPMAPVTAILASPKAQFYPAYVKQRAIAGATTTARYASYAPVPGATEAHLARPELAGRKRYPIRPWPPAGPNPYGAGAAQMGTALHPLPAGARFAGRVRFDNLKPEELGALVWALRLWAPCWGPRPALRHALGMGKPYGFGAVEIELSAARVEANAPAAGGRRNLLANGDDSTAIDHALGYADRFAEHMEAAWKEKAGKRAGAGWAASEQIEMLLGLALEASADDARSLRYLSLADREFTDAKRAKEVLAPAPRHAAGAGAPGSATEDTSFPRADTAAPRATAAPPPRAGRFARGQRVYVVEDGEDATVMEMVGPDRVRVRYRDGGTEVVPVSGLTTPR